MFEQMSGFQAPSDDTVIWKYMDMTKLLSILEKEALFFPTVNLLRKIDSWEGSWSNYNFSQYVGGTEETQKATRDLLFPIMSEAYSKRLCISCWHMNEYESTAMWKLHLTANEGIVVRTTFGELKQCFDYEHSSWHYMGGNFADRKVPLFAGKVEYIDWDHAEENTSSFKQVLFKGKSFEHEHELRIVAQLNWSPADPPLTRNEKGETIEDTTLGLSTEVLKQVDELNHEAGTFPVACYEPCTAKSAP